MSQGRAAGAVLASPAVLEWTLVALAIAVAAGALVAWYARRAGRRTLWRHRGRVDRYKLTRKSYVIAHVLAEPDVAAAVRFLAGPESSWITGQSFAADGGNELRGAPRG